MIKIRNLKYTPKKSDFSIDCMNMTVESGKRLGVYGAAASGKTLFTEILAGLVKNYSGSIEIGITDLKSTYRKKIGYVPFNNILYSDLSVKEMSLLMLDQYKVPESELKVKSDWFSNYFNLNELIARKICSLTSGQLQTVKFFTGIIHSPSVLIIDEPFNGLGDDSLENLNMFLTDLVKSDVSVIAASSHKELLEKITDTTANILNGKIE